MRKLPEEYDGARRGAGTECLRIAAKKTRGPASVDEMRGSEEIYFRGDELSDAQAKPLQVPTQVAQ
jgi:hypothetical protein